MWKKIIFALNKFFPVFKIRRGGLWWMGAIKKLEKGQTPFLFFEKNP